MVEIVVTGTHIKRRDFSSVSPLSTVGPAAVEFSGRPMLEETLNGIPQVIPDLRRVSVNWLMYQTSV